ncbi:hypothetical protein, partial [Pseudomonas sp. MYb185]|uniref:hypothetical protein n=1 Tax=Pseudomonas sp. MYb185 TaxID=1848729 RepID=UPI001C48DC1B
WLMLHTGERENSLQPTEQWKYFHSLARATPACSLVKPLLKSPFKDPGITLGTVEHRLDG